MNRASMLFSYVSAKGRAAGWSESWYVPGQPAEVYQLLVGCATARVKMLPGSVTINGLRIAVNVDNPLLPARSISYGVDMPGTVERFPQDVPQMALLCKAISPDGLSVRNFTLRGMPDEVAIRGDYNDVGGVGPNFRLYVRYLAANGFCFRSGNPANAKVPLVKINAGGQYQLGADLVYNQGDALKMFRVSDIDGKPVKGAFSVAIKVDARNGTLANWTGQSVNASGSVSKVTAFSYPTVTANNTEISRVVTRKVGRPIVVYHGRQRRRR